MPILPVNPETTGTFVAGTEEAPTLLTAQMNVVAVTDAAEPYVALPASAFGTRKTIYNEGGFPAIIKPAPGAEFLVGGSGVQQITLMAGFAVDVRGLDDQWLVFVSS